MEPESTENYFLGARRPLLAALATNAARPSAVGWIVGAVAVLTAFVCAVADAQARGMVATTVASLAAVAAVLGGPTVAAQQAFADRQSGALDQHRLAGRSPGEMLSAYVLGPSWALTLCVWSTAIAASLCNLDASAHARASAWIPLVVAASTTAAMAGWSVNAVAVALGIDRALPVTQASGVGLVAPLLRLPLYGVVFAATRDEGLPALLALEALLLGLSARFALRRFASEEDELDTSRARTVAVVGAAAVAAMLGAAHVAHHPRGIAFPVVATVLLLSAATSVFSPARGAMFRAWVARGEAADAALARAGVWSSALASLAVLGSRVGDPARIDGGVISAALFAGAFTAALRAVSASSLAGAPRTRVGWALFAVLATPSVAWMASRLGPARHRLPGPSAFAAAISAPFADVHGPTDLALRAVACGLLFFAAESVSRRLLRASRVAALAKVQGR